MLPDPDPGPQKQLNFMPALELHRKDRIAYLQAAVSTDWQPCCRRSVQAVLSWVRPFVPVAARNACYLAIYVERGGYR